MRITKHAKHRLSQRGGVITYVNEAGVTFKRYTVQDIINTVNNGVKLVNRTDPAKFTFIDNSTGMYVVTNSEVTVVITVFWKGQ